MPRTKPSCMELLPLSPRRDTTDCVLDVKMMYRRCLVCPIRCTRPIVWASSSAESRGLEKRGSLGQLIPFAPAWREVGCSYGLICSNFSRTGPLPPLHDDCSFPCIHPSTQNESPWSCKARQWVAERHPMLKIWVPVSSAKREMSLKYSSVYSNVDARECQSFSCNMSEWDDWHSDNSFLNSWVSEVTRSNTTYFNIRFFPAEKTHLSHNSGNFRTVLNHTRRERLEFWNGLFFLFLFILLRTGRCCCRCCCCCRLTTSSNQIALSTLLSTNTTRHRRAWNQLFCVWRMDTWEGTIVV